MSDNYLPGLAGYRHNGETGDTTDQQGALYKALLAQTMASNGSTGIGGIAAHVLGTYAMMQGMQPQSLSVDAGGASGMQQIPDSTYGVSLAMPDYG